MWNQRLHGVLDSSVRADIALGNIGGCKTMLVLTGAQRDIVTVSSHMALAGVNTEADLSAAHVDYEVPTWAAPSVAHILPDAKLGR